ncbi:MAG: hypothetical protein IJ457_00370 [Clostridia bacterium]|nr:hypothetical protein [Clostridia bacterium]
MDEVPRYCRMTVYTADNAEVVCHADTPSFYESFREAGDVYMWLLM